MKKLRLIKPWHLRTVRQRVADSSLKREGIAVDACKAPFAKNIVNVRPRKDVGITEYSEVACRPDNRSCVGLVPYFEITNFNSQKPDKRIIIG